MDRKSVAVKWVDPYSIDEWTSIGDGREPVLHIESFGYEVFRDENITVIALNYDPDNEKMSCATVIPNECVKEYRYVKDTGDGGEGSHGQGDL